MKKYLLLLIVFNLNVMAAESRLSDESNTTKKESKKFVIDLDKEKKDAKERGNYFDRIKGLIPLGHNDEVAFLGKKVLVLKPIKLYVNDVLKKTIRSAKEILSIKTSELTVGDTIVIKNGKGTPLVEKKVVK